jgi:hypothetical protein
VARSPRRAGDDWPEEPFADSGKAAGESDFCGLSWASRLAPAHRRTRLSFGEIISGRVGYRTDKTQGWV